MKKFSSCLSPTHLYFLSGNIHACNSVLQERPRGVSFSLCCRDERPICESGFKSLFQVNEIPSRSIGAPQRFDWYQGDKIGRFFAFWAIA
jgi:hypothetical protein